MYVGHPQWISDANYENCRWWECTAQNTYSIIQSDWETAKTKKIFKDQCYHSLKGCWDDTNAWKILLNRCG